MQTLFVMSYYNIKETDIVTDQYSEMKWLTHTDKLISTESMIQTPSNPDG